jgi:hypothetical protein
MRGLWVLLVVVVLVPCLASDVGVVEQLAEPWSDATEAVELSDA